MAQLIELPHVGESVVEGTIGKWLKQPGDHVERYDPLVEVVTDKVTMEVPSPVAGELLRIIAQEGETVPMGAPIAEVDDGSGPAAGAPPAASGVPGDCANAGACPGVSSSVDPDVVPDHGRPSGWPHRRISGGSADPGRYQRGRSHTGAGGPGNSYGSRRTR